MSSSTVVTLSFSYTICRVKGRWSKSKRRHIVHKKQILRLLYTEDEREGEAAEHIQMRASLFSFYSFSEWLNCTKATNEK